MNKFVLTQIFLFGLAVLIGWMIGKALGDSNLGQK